MRSRVNVCLCIRKLTEHEVMEAGSGFLESLNRPQSLDSSRDAINNFVK